MSLLARWSAALLIELARCADVGAFVEGYTPDDPLRERVRAHDLAAVHWRNSLFAYDLSIYQLADDATADFVHDALCDWPGIVVLHGDDPQALFARAPRLRRAVLEQSLAVVVRTRSLRDRLHAAELWTSLYVLEDRREPVTSRPLPPSFSRSARPRSRHAAAWVEELLETACAEMPNSTPGDASAPWRTEVDELSSLGGPPNGSFKGLRRARGSSESNAVRR